MQTHHAAPFLFITAILLPTLACSSASEDQNTTHQPTEDMGVAKDLNTSITRDVGQQTDQSVLMEDMKLESEDAGLVDASMQQQAVPSAGCDSPGALKPGETTVRSLARDGQMRTWRVRLPKGASAGEPMPVLLALHGGFGSGENTELETMEFNPIADREGIIMVYPNGSSSRPNAQSLLLRAQTWNAGECCGSAQKNNIDDVGFLLQVVESVQQEACVDRRRVYSTGMSNGGMMSYRLACEASEHFAGIAPVGGSLILDPCQPKRAVPMIHVHGLKDINVPFEGGGGCGPGDVSKSQAVEDVQAAWSSRLECQEEKITLLDREDVTCTSFKGCEQKLQLCTLPEGSHSWPGGVPREPNSPNCDNKGKQVLTFDASEAIWSFLSKQSLDQLP